MEIIFIVALLFVAIYLWQKNAEKKLRIERLEREKTGEFPSVKDIPEELLEPEELLDRLVDEVHDDERRRNELNERTNRMRALSTGNLPVEFPQTYRTNWEPDETAECFRIENLVWLWTGYQSENKTLQGTLETTIVNRSQAPASSRLSLKFLDNRSQTIRILSGPQFGSIPPGDSKVVSFDFCIEDIGIPGALSVQSLLLTVT